jgi:hypothetical protein
MKSLSMVNGPGSLSHNNRTGVHLPVNVDPDRVKDNVVLVEPQTIQEAYDLLFAESARQYNEGLRSDRQYDCYYEKLFKQSPDNANSIVNAPQRGRPAGSKKKPIVQKSYYEDLMQIGKKEDTGVGTPDAEVAKNALIDWFNGSDALGIPSYQERNPNLHVFNAVIHMDEATPHMHIDYIPWYESMRGQSVQQGVNRALEACGHGSRDDPDIRNNYRLAERKVFEEICNHHGIEVKPAEPGRGYSYVPDEYREKMQATDNRIAEQQEEIKLNQGEIVSSRKEAQEAKQQLTEVNTALAGSEQQLAENTERKQRQDTRYLQNNKIIEDQVTRVKGLTDDRDELTTGNEALAATRIALERSVSDLRRQKEQEELEYQEAQKRTELATQEYQAVASDVDDMVGLQSRLKSNISKMDANIAVLSKAEENLKKPKQKTFRDGIMYCFDWLMKNYPGDKNKSVFTKMFSALMNEQDEKDRIMKEAEKISAEYDAWEQHELTRKEKDYGPSFR